MGANSDCEHKNTETGRLAAQLPDEEQALLEEAAVAVDAHHAAVLDGDVFGAEEGLARKNAVVWKLNGGTFFDCRAERDRSAGHIVDRHCEAAPGTVPKWGQTGEFLVSVDGMRAVVEVGSGFLTGTVWVNFHAVDLGAPFLSGTGYRSHYRDVGYGQTVLEAAEQSMAELMASQGRFLIELAYRASLEVKPVRPWLLNDEKTALRSAFEDAYGQLALALSE